MFEISIWAFRTRGDASVFSGVLRGKLGWTYMAGSDLDHLRVTMEWLCAAQDVLPDGGVPAFYDVRNGEWGPAYPETTGYIIPTFFDYALLCKDDQFRRRAIRMADWLTTLQLENGAFPIGPLWPEWDRTPVVFDTGQILHGLVRAYLETGKKEYLRSAQRAGDWLAGILDQDGSWRKHTTLGLVHIYNVRTAWGLLELFEVSNDETYRSAAVRNLDWALSQQMEDGWFQNASFRAGEDPLTHTIAYTIEGLLKSGIILDEPRYLEAAQKAADALLATQEEDRLLRGRFGPVWCSGVNWVCLTGTAQMAENWLLLYELCGDEIYRVAAYKAIQYVKQRQSRKSNIPGIKGGIAGSFPIYKDYEPYRHLNWAAKFFADSLIRHIKQGHKDVE